MALVFNELSNVPTLQPILLLSENNMGHLQQTEMKMTPDPDVFLERPANHCSVFYFVIPLLKEVGEGYTEFTLSLCSPVGV